MVAIFLLLGGCSSVQSLPVGENDVFVDSSVHLSGQRLKKIPDHIFKQTHIKELDVSNNALSGSIQAEIRQLTNLEVLNASNNQMTGIPAEIGQLKHLRILDLSNNVLTGLPYELGNLKTLEVLNISGNNYSEEDLNFIIKKLPSSVTIVR